MLGQFTGEEQSDGGLDLSGRDGLALVVMSEAGSLSCDPLEDVVHERVHDGHALGADSGVGVHLLQDFVDVDGVRFLPLPLAFLVTDGTAGLLSCLLLGFLSSNWRHLKLGFLRFLSEIERLGCSKLGVILNLAYFIQTIFLTKPVDQSECAKLAGRSLAAFYPMRRAGFTIYTRPGERAKLT